MVRPAGPPPPPSSADSRGGGRVLVDPHASLKAGAAQAPGQPPRIDQRVAGGVLQAAAPPRRAELGPGAVGAEDLDLVAELTGRDRLLVEPVELPVGGREGQLAARLEVAVDAEPGDRLADLPQVLRPEPLQQRHLGSEPLQAVADPVGQAGGAEPAVAPGRGPRRRLRLQQDDVLIGVALAGQQGGPQAGEAAPDDRQVRGDRPGQGTDWLGGVRLVEPERPGSGPGQRPGDSGVAPARAGSDHDPTVAHGPCPQRRGPFTGLGRHGGSEWS